LGVDELCEGVNDEVPELPEFPELPEVPEVPELPVLPVVPVLPDDVAPPDDDVDEPEPVRRDVLAPEWSCATTTPMTAVAPVAARTAPRVRARSRDWAFALLWGVYASSFGVIGGDLNGGTHPSHHGRIETVAVPAVALL
jgi:hypothetical protein